MKKNRIIIMLFLSTVMLSCGSPEETDDTSESVFKVTSDSIVEEDIHVEEDFQELTSNEVFLEELPSKWLKLTSLTDIVDTVSDEWVIYHWCYAELPQIWIEAGKGDEWVLTALYGQDSEQWYINNFQATEQEPISSNFGEKRSVEFWWNKDIYFASFSGVYEQETFFVAEADRGMYTEIDEECDYDDH